MDGQRAFGLALRYQLLALVVTAVGVGIAYGGAYLGFGGARGLYGALGTPSAIDPTGIQGAGLGLLALGAVVVLLGRTVAFYRVVGSAVEADIDEQLTGIERDLNRELRSLKRELTVSDEALEERVAALESATDGVGGPATGRTASDRATGRQDIPRPASDDPDEGTTSDGTEIHSDGAGESPASTGEH